ncbi:MULTISPECIES: 16S rRNA (guanine(966)-N(2))-methyltransferase RsmD [unclassified Undibacterium]|uniref:16S rRNA (guanine(966)-N(2))-methyltransferase RsmD n=2 Tax=unclassified Undibacterium TaxID=2630295 RepID=UPI002AC953A5|nr:MULTISPECIES: 16S rRNA (guanine(966)-N(2))-methyltransferase RsmD [unclassified Undibacterium]WPX45095.1 16S rRNA (guanine(966)-N(2))-methyltransferase RsmD [Undibacterium sp. CCC3.4]
MKPMTKKTPSVSRSSHQVRIIGGQWKRSLLSVVSAEGLRPTPDRVRETTFNWLNHLFNANWMTLRCLDLFAGSGALGFEAASRGAAAVTMVEASAPAFRQLLAVQEKLAAQQCRLLRADASKAIASLAPASCELIFLDPPFEQAWLEKMLPACQPLLATPGYVYVESEFALDHADPSESMKKLLSGWQVIRADRAGSVYFHILQRSILQPDTHENQA